MSDFHPIEAIDALSTDDVQVTTHLTPYADGLIYMSLPDGLMVGVDFDFLTLFKESETFRNWFLQNHAKIEEETSKVYYATA